LHVADLLVVENPIGRQRELDCVRGWVSELAAGRGRAVLVDGEPGIGKSSLIRFATGDAEAAGCRVLWATCDELSQAFPLLPLLDALDGQPVRGGTRTNRNGHRSGTGQRLAELMLADASPGNRVDVVAAVAERLLALVDEVCSATPLMLVVDDLQWADPATVSTVGRLARSVRQIPLLLVGTARPVPRREDVSALRRTLDPASILALQGLSDAEVANLVESLVGCPPGPGLLRMAAGAAGNPLFVFELVGALMRGGDLVEDRGRAEVSGGRPPENLSAAITERLEFLPAQVRDMLRVAALLGVDFSVSELAVVSDRRVNDLLPVIDDAIAAGVLLDDGPELAFRHPLVR